VQTELSRLIETFFFFGPWVATSWSRAKKGRLSFFLPVPSDNFDVHPKDGVFT
jgi:hypothetical protein